MASVEGRIDSIDELKECLRVSIEMLLNGLNDRLHEDMDGIDYLCAQLDRIQSLVERASTLYSGVLHSIGSLKRAQNSLKSLATGKEGISLFASTGCRGRPSLYIPEELLQLYLDYQFSMTKIGEIFGFSSKTIQRRMAQYDLKKIAFAQLSDSELDDQVSDILKMFPNCGYRRMRGFLRAKGLHIQWCRIQDSMKRVCPEGILMRALQLHTKN